MKGFKIAIIYQDDRVYVEFSPEDFRKLLKQYFKETKSIDKALDKIILELREETKYS